VPVKMVKTQNNKHSITAHGGLKKGKKKALYYL
jgi:hypothetical protein